MANSRVQQESKMQQQHYGINTHPVMTTIEQFRYRQKEKKIIRSRIPIQKETGSYKQH